MEARLYVSDLKKLLLKKILLLFTSPVGINVTKKLNSNNVAFFWCQGLHFSDKHMI
jgi:hypothetical protein